MENKKSNPADTNPDLNMSWHTLALSDVFVALKSAAQGLTSEEVAKRLAH